MPDIHTQIQRSRNMAAVKSKNTGPEIQVRRALHRLGYRYRLHANNLPGTPDIVFPGRKKAILVHGCYWHMHKCFKGQSEPKTNSAFWRRKRIDNVKRDAKNIKHLKNLGWDVLTVWECQIRKPRFETNLTRFLNCDRKR